MKTSTYAARRLGFIALAALALTACKPERSGTTTAPEEAAPTQDELAPPATGGSGASGGAGGSATPSINATQGDANIAPDAPSFSVAGLAFPRPEGWTLVEPGPMRAAELVNPGVPGGAIVFTHFGARGAGAIPDNLTRWARQVVDESGEPTLPQVTEASSEVGGVTRTITLARYEGNYMSGMPGQTPTPNPGTLFLGAIIEGGPQGTVYVRAFGPRDAMEPQVDAVLAMLLAESHE